MTARVSQATLAEALGLSQRAVSMALRGETGVSVATRQRVQAAARRLGYRSNRLARSLIDGETKIIGAHTPGLSGLFLSQLFDGANEALAERGYSLMISRWQERHTEGDATELNVLLQYCVEGIIAVPRSLGPWKHTVYPDLARRGENVVVVNQRVPIPGLCSVYSDDVHGSAAAIRFLLAQGHRRIACVTADGPYATSYRLRRAGCQRALAEAGLALPPSDVCDSMTEPLARWLGETFGRHPHPTALFCFNDGLALEAIAALAARGLRVPEDVAVVGYGNDIPHPNHLRVPLTTVNQCADTMGRRAAEQLLLMLGGGEAEPEIVVPTSLIVRQSAPGDVANA